MPRLLVLYASKHGHTAKIAERIGLCLRRDGDSADVCSIKIADSLALDSYDAVIAGASVHAGHHQHDMVQWLARHAAKLNARPSAFFSVSLAAADDNEEAGDQGAAYIDDLLHETGWTPEATASFAGALQYREYDFFTRMLMRLLMARGKHPTDTSRDYDYTDWAAVDRFALEVAAAPRLVVRAGPH